MKRQLGISQMELLLVVGVIGLAASAVMAMASGMHGKAKVEAVAVSTGALVQNLEKAIGRRQSYYGLTNAKAMEQNLVPDEFRDQGQAATPWGPLTIEPVGALNDGIRLTFEGVPSKHCADFVNRLAPLMAATRVNGRLVGQDRQVDIPVMTEACSQGGIVVVDRIEAGYGREAVWQNGSLIALAPLPPGPSTTTPPGGYATPAPLPPAAGSEPPPGPPVWGDPEQTPGPLPDRPDPVDVPPAPPTTAPGVPEPDPASGPLPPPPCGVKPHNGSRTVVCPSGYTGSLQQSHGWTGGSWPGCWIQGPWKTVSGSCTAIPPPPPPPPPPAPCGPQPESAYRTLACPTGYTGSRLQSYGWTAAGPPVCWIQGPWVTVYNGCRAK